MFCKTHKVKKAVEACPMCINAMANENQQLKDQLESVKSKSIVKRQTLLLQTENKQLREQIDFAARAAKTLEQEVGIVIKYLERNKK